jgi:uncharacterized protein YabE (DUF348 family)
VASEYPPKRTIPHRLLNPQPAASAWTGMVMLAVVLGLLLLGGSLFVLTQKTITVEVDGEITTIYTRQTTVGGALTELGLVLQPQDTLSPTSDTLLENGTVVRVHRALSVYVTADGHTTELLTHARSPLDLLAEAGITLGRYDRVLLDGVPVMDPALPFTGLRPAVVAVVRAVEMTIDDDGTLITIYTTEPTVGQALYAIGLELYLADAVDPAPDTPTRDGLHVTVRRSVPLVVTVDGIDVTTRTHAATVAGALAEAGLALVGDDYSLPAPEAPLPADGRIRVVRVTEDVIVERTEVPYTTAYRPDDELEIDSYRVLQAGAPGVQERRTRIRYEDGVEVSRVEEPPRITQPAAEEVIAYGTRIVIRTIDTPDGPRDYWRTIRMLATSYTPATSSKPADAPSYGLGSTGVRVEQGVVAVDPEVIPYFTQVFVPGYGVGLAADTGGAINGRRIDLGYSDDDLVLWYSWVDVYVLTPVPPVDEIRYLLP